MTPAALLIAAAATVYATASLLTGFNDDFTGAAIVAVVALAVVVFTEHARYLRECRRAEREATWARRDREAGL